MSQPTAESTIRWLFMVACELLAISAFAFYLSGSVSSAEVTPVLLMLAITLIGVKA